MSAAFLRYEDLDRYSIAFYSLNMCAIVPIRLWTQCKWACSVHILHALCTSAMGMLCAYFCNEHALCICVHAMCISAKDPLFCHFWRSDFKMTIESKGGAALAEVASDQPLYAIVELAGRVDAVSLAR